MGILLNCALKKNADVVPGFCFNDILKTLRMIYNLPYKRFTVKSALPNTSELPVAEGLLLI